MDENTPSRSTARWRSRSRWPSPLVTTFWSIVFVNLLLIYVAFEMESSSSSAGGDAAGNAMSAGFTGLMEYAALFIVGVPTLLFTMIRRQGLRLAMAIVLGLNAFVLLMLASLIHGHP